MVLSHLGNKTKNHGLHISDQFQLLIKLLNETERTQKTMTLHRAPLGATNRHNTRSGANDLDQLAWELKISDLSTKKDGYRSKFETESATISSFKSTSSKHSALTELISNKSAGYEYLCRVLAIKQWLEQVLQTPITQKPAELLTYVRNGIYLAKLANKFLPTKRSIYTNDSKLDFRHTENINSFFRLLRYLELPTLFFFELTDLFDGKDIPKVWYCLHALSYRINIVSPDIPLIQNLVGEAKFTLADIDSANRMLMGRQLPGFSDIDIDSFTSPVKNSFVNKALNLTSPSKTPNIASHIESFKDDPIPDLSFSPATIRKLNLELNRKLAALSEETPRAAAVIKSNTEPSYKMFSQKMSSHVDNIVRIQALCRGSMLRYKMFVDKILLRSYAPEIEEFLTIARGYMVRNKKFHGHRKDVKLFERDVCHLQGQIRGFLLRLSWRKFQKDDNMNQLKALIRGQKVRAEKNRVESLVHQHGTSIINLQSCIRKRKVGGIVTTILKHLDSLIPKIILIQSNARAILVRDRLEKIRTNSELPLLSEFQSIARGALTRNRVRQVLRQSFQRNALIIDFQAIIRGAVLRTKLCNSVLISLVGKDHQMNVLFSKARGNSCRRRIADDQAALNSNVEEVLALQSLFRGVLTRFQLEDKVETLYESIDSIISIQSMVRARRSRKIAREFHIYYRNNEQAVIAAQAILKKIFAQTAYKIFINKKNPPLSVIKKFSFLLLDKNLDFLEDSRLNDYKDKILELAKLNEELELQIDSIDIKLAMLDKNIISTDEFMAQRTKFSTFKPTYKSVNVCEKTNLLSRSAKKRLDLYQSLFYILQTNPLYFTRYLNSLRTQSADTLSNAVNLIMRLYPFRSSDREGAREEYFVIKLIVSVIKSDYNYNGSNIADITKMRQSIWIRLFSSINNHTRHRKAIMNIYGGLLRNLWEDESTSFESDPSIIHLQLRNAEIKIHGSSQRPETISASEAIADPEVSEKFVSNLMQLRDFTADFLQHFTQNIPNLPLHVRIIAKETYKLSRVHFPEHSEQMHLSVAGVVVIKQYISNIFNNPSLYGLGKSKNRKNSLNAVNFIHLGRVLLQIFSMKPFKDNFMKPLNEFVLSYVVTIKGLVRSLIDVKDLEAEYEINEFDDLVNNEKPTLTLKVCDMISIDRLVTEQLQIVAPNSDDQLRGVISKLEEIHNGTEDYAQLAELGNYTLLLAPASNIDTIEDSKKKMLMEMAKRFVLCLLSVQNGENLLELLIQGITPQHERIFKMMIENEKAAGLQISQDEQALTFAGLKQKLLQVFLQLETMGEISRDDGYQEILNLIILDIKTKGYRREFRSNQLRIAQDTVSRLIKKKSVLEKQLNDYNKHVNGMLESLQLKPKEKKFLNIIPVFSRQYFYHRQLRKNNCLPKFGSYKHSVKKLTELGTIKRISHKLNQSKLDIKISCHAVGVFTIEAASSSVNVPGACSVVTLDDVLDRQQDNLQEWPMCDKMVVFDTDSLASMIFKHFYEVNIK